MNSITRLILLALLAGLALAGGTPGSLDPAFGTGGIVSTPTDRGELLALAAQSDGRLIGVGHDPNGRWAIRRYATDGTLEATFDPNLEGQAYDVAVDAADRIVVVGDATIEREVGKGKKKKTERVRGHAVLRLAADGSPDQTFGDGGLVFGEETDSAAAVALQPDGRIVVSARATATSGGGKGKGKKPTTTSGAIVLLRFNGDGTPDAGFGDGGIVTDDVTAGDDDAGFGALVVQGTGHIVVGVSRLDGANAMALGRYDAGGDLVAAWQSSGHVLAQSGLAVDSQDRLLAAGWRDLGLNDTEGVLVRFLADGTPDASFASGGVFTTGLAQRDQLGPIAPQAGGKILVGGMLFTQGGGTFEGVDAFVARLNDNGTLDASFGGDGYSDLSTPGDVETDLAPRDMAVVAGNPIVCGERFLADSGGPISWLLVRYCGN